ncbi:MAG: hypothetical protein FIB06_06050 [Betaproteobacteria bacterium]|nr:hypothetical protein [Betaproteobacteria bacterium]
MKRLKELALILCLAGLPGIPAHADDTLGRLFFTPAQRAAFDRERLLGIARNPSALEGESSYTFDGQVRRSSGRNTRWINGEPQPGDGPAPPVAPGDTYHPATGERDSLIGDGRITVRRPRAQP